MTSVVDMDGSLGTTPTWLLPEDRSSPWRLSCDVILRAAQLSLGATLPWVGIYLHGSLNRAPPCNMLTSREVPATFSSLS